MEHWLKWVNTVTNLSVIEFAKATNITHFFYKKDNSRLIQVFHNKEFLSLLLLVLTFFVK